MDLTAANSSIKSEEYTEKTFLLSLDSKTKFIILIFILTVKNFNSV